MINSLQHAAVQVGEQLAHTQRSEASLQRRLKSLLELQQQAEQGAAKASAQVRHARL